MIDASILIVVIPPLVTGVFAYLIAIKKNKINERINKAKLDSEIHSQALKIVREVVNDMRDEFHREIKSLKEENERLRKKIESNDDDIKRLTAQCLASDALIDILQKEIGALRNTAKVYEDEIDRLTNK